MSVWCDWTFDVSIVISRQNITSIVAPGFSLLDLWLLVHADMIIWSNIEIAMFSSADWKKIIDLVSRNSTSGQDDPYGFILSWNFQCSCRAFSNNRKYLSRLITIIVSICQDVLRKIKMLLKAYEHNLYFRYLINVYIFFGFFFQSFMFLFLIAKIRLKCI